MPLYLFQATFDGGQTPIFAANFECPGAAERFVQRINNQLKKECPGKRTSFRKITNTRSRRLPKRMRTFSKPRRMTSQSIRKMPGVPERWKIKPVQKQERRAYA